MGRKGECGGTAGGGRSGSRGNVTYSRVIPKFLQKLADSDYTSNPLDAKRPSATGHAKEPKPRYCESRRSARPQKADPENEIKRLEAQGFNVVIEGKADTVPPGEERNTTDPDFDIRNTARARGNKLQVVGGIEKRNKRAHNSTVGVAFDMKNKQKLSFVESDSEDE